MSSVSVTDGVIGEIAEQVSQIIRMRMKWQGTPFDIKRGVEMYQAHLDLSVPSIEMNLPDATHLSPEDGGAPNESGVYVLSRDEGHKYVGRAIEDRTGQATKGLRKRLKEHDRGASTSSKEIRLHRKELTTKMYPTGSTDAAKSLESRKIAEFKTHRDHGGWNKKRESQVSPFPDVGRRFAGIMTTGVLSDLVSFAVGGGAMEIREAWRNPSEMGLLERCRRLVRAIWERLPASVKDRFVREIGSEAILVLVLKDALMAPLRIAVATVETIVAALRRLWMEFVEGKIRTVSDVVAAVLKAVFVAVSVGVIIAVEAALTPLFGGILAPIFAAVIAGVMIVGGNRSIDHIVQSLAGIFHGAHGIARRRREEIEAFCAEHIPQLVADREQLESMVETHFSGRDALFESTFADLQSARDCGDLDGFLSGLQKLNAAYGKSLPWNTQREFDEFMLDDSQSLKL